MSPKVQEYRRNAEEAEKQAASVTDEIAKATYHNVAAHWRELADKAERRGD